MGEHKHARATRATTREVPLKQRPIGQAPLAPVEFAVLPLPNQLALVGRVSVGATTVLDVVSPLPTEIILACVGGGGGGGSSI